MWQSNNKAWVTHILFVEWVNEVFGTAMTNYQLENNAAAEPPSFENDLLDEFNFIKFKFLPPKTIPLIQPMDQQIIPNFKKLYTKALFQEYFEVTEQTNLTLQALEKPFTYCELPQDHQ